MLKFLDGSYYKGEFLNNEIHGKGNSISIQVNMYGVKIENMKGIGNTIKCTDMGQYNGLMVGSTKDNMKMTRNMEKELFIGPMEENMQADGKTENSMEKDIFTYKMEL